MMTEKEKTLLRSRCAHVIDNGYFRPRYSATIQVRALDIINLLDSLDDIERTAFQRGVESGTRFPHTS